MTSSDVIEIATVKHLETQKESVSQNAVREQFRRIAVRVESSLALASKRALVVTSPARGDGKTTTALQLGLTLAGDMGRRVAIVDANLRAPALAQLLGLTPRQGLADLVAGKATLDELLWRVGDSDLVLLPGCPRSLVERTPGGMPTIVSTVTRLQSHYDYVLVDTPSLSESADALVLSRNSQGVVLAVRLGATRRDALATSLELLADTRIIGCVVHGATSFAGSALLAEAR